MAGPKETTPDVRWGLMDAVLSVVSPRSAARRYAARVAISNLRRNYEAAARGRGTSGWKAGSTSADAEIAGAGAMLRDRMRDLVRNNPEPRLVQRAAVALRDQRQRGGGNRRQGRRALV